MIQTKRGLLIALLIPILALLALTAYKKSVLSFGEEIILPISGYDPRDLLSGHYLIYTIDYGVPDLCRPYSSQQDGYVCLNPKTFSSFPPENCTQLIRGTCRNGRFEAGIEKYFVPQDKALYLEKQIQSKAASIVLSLTASGHTQVKDLLIEGKSWK